MKNVTKYQIKLITEDTTDAVKLVQLLTSSLSTISQVPIVKNDCYILNMTHNERTNLVS